MGVKDYVFDTLMQSSFSMHVCVCAFMTFELGGRHVRFLSKHDRELSYPTTVYSKNKRRMYCMNEIIQEISFFSPYSYILLFEWRYARKQIY